MSSPSLQPVPRVSVIMPVYDVEQYIKKAVDSILEQTYSDFELIAVNDGSPDNSLKILEKYARQDDRIHVVSQENRGLVATLNRGISLARGEYIARMDPDDISFPRRFEQQVAVLDAYSSVVLVAGGFEVIDQDDEFLYREVIPVHNEDIKRSMFLRNPIAHGSVMFRKKAFDIIGGYSSTCGPMEDFYLWTQLAKLGEIEAVESAVYRWRVNSNGITSNKNKEVLAATKRHIDTLWVESFPQVLGTRELRRRGMRYFRTYKKRGVDMKNVVWADNTRIAVKMIRRGHLVKGLQQLLAVALTGRAGIKAVIHRFKLITQGSSQAVGRQARAKMARRYARYGQQDI